MIVIEEYVKIINNTLRKQTKESFSLLYMSSKTTTKKTK